MLMTEKKILILLFFIKSKDSFQWYNPDDLSIAQKKFTLFLTNVAMAGKYYYGIAYGFLDNNSFS